MTSPATGPGEPDVTVDALGQRCPLPVIALARRVAAVPTGTLVGVLADDEAARLDVPAWCGMRGQEYVGEVDAPCGRLYLVRRTT